MGTERLHWPEGKRFAFTIVDDTDFASVGSAKPIYDFLADCGMRTTKTVWPLRAHEKGLTGGGTLEEPEYRNWILRLQAQGVEIALHGVADGNSCRERIERGLDYFRDVIGGDPAVHTNHAAQGEGMYWGPARLDGPLRWLYHGYRRTRSARRYEGAAPESARFWGDVCRERIKYVRNFVFQGINTAANDLLMPYHDTRRPYVRYWFSGSNGGTPEAFERLVSEANQEKLEAEGGACIVYTHFGIGFHPLGTELRRLVRRLSRRAGWFVPATTLLDHIGEVRGWRVVDGNRAELRRMQWRWALERGTQQVVRAFAGVGGGRRERRPETAVCGARVGDSSR